MCYLLREILSISIKYSYTYWKKKKKKEFGLSYSSPDKKLFFIVQIFLVKLNVSGNLMFLDNLGILWRPEYNSTTCLFY